MKGLTTVFKKEVRENIRDRRALFNSLLLGPLLFPLLFVGMMWFLESAEKERAEKTLEGAHVPIEVGARVARHEHHGHATRHLRVDEHVGHPPLRETLGQRAAPGGLVDAQQHR